MLSPEDIRIIEDEISRLDKRYSDTQERYGITGSASSDRTMHRLGVIRDALERYRTNNSDSAKDRMIAELTFTLRAARERVAWLKEQGQLAAGYAEALAAILEGKAQL